MFIDRALASAIALCIISSSATAQKALSKEASRFVKHPLHCAHFIGGEEYGDGVGPDYSRALSAALGKPSALDASKLDQIERACATELASRSGMKVAAVKTSAAKSAK